MLKKYFVNWRDYLPLWISLLAVIIISSISLHSDFIVVSKVAERIALGNLHIYQNIYIGDVKMGKPIMPPLICLVDGFFYSIVNGLKLINFNYDLSGQISLFNLLLLKSRYILVFLLSYPLIYQAALKFTKRNKEQSRKIANLWIASPLLLYLPFAQGNNDIYPAVFSLVFLYFAFRKNFLLAMLFLGLTAAMKNYAIFLILPVALILSQKEWKKTFLYCATAGAVYIIPAIIYYNEFYNFTSGNSENWQMLQTVIPSYAFGYSIFVMGYFFILFLLLFGNNMKKIVENTNNMLVTYCFVIMSLFYVTFFNPQWFVWILPFFVFLIYQNKKLYLLYLLIASVSFVSLIVNWSNNLDLSLWKRILPALATGTALAPGFVDSPTKIVVSSLFVSLFMVFIYFLFKDDEDKEEVRSNHIYLSYLPTVALLVALALFAFITVRSSNQTTLKNNSVIHASATEVQGSYSLSGTQISNEGVLKNITVNNASFTPTNNEPQIILRNIEYSSSDHSYLIIRLKNAQSIDPQIYWDTNGDNVYTQANTLWLNMADTQTYYVKLSQKFIDSKPKTVMIDPETKMTPFEIESIKIVDIN